jgi:hypothetical protein
MENKLYFYIEDCNGGFVADESYMDNEFDHVTQKLLMVGTLEDIENHINWLCNNK